MYTFVNNRVHNKPNVYKIRGKKFILAQKRTEKWSKNAENEPEKTLKNRLKSGKKQPRKRVILGAKYPEKMLVLWGFFAIFQYNFLII